MELIKKLTGKNPAEYEPIVEAMINNSDTELFKKLVDQDDFLFDFIKDNVAKRILKACNKDNYLNLLDFLDIYSSSYDTVIAQVLHEFGKDAIFVRMKDLYLNGSNFQKAYALKYFTFANSDNVKDLLSQIRETAKSDFEALSLNSIEVLSLLNDEISKNEAINKLNSEDEFEKYNAVKFLVVYGARDVLPEIIDTMKKTSLSENIASEIPYLIPLRELLETDFENGLLIIANIINAIPDIIPPSAVCSYDLKDAFEYIVSKHLESTSAVIIRMAKDKFSELVSNEEYLFDSDKNTKDEIKFLNDLVSRFNTSKLESLLYDELYDESDFVFFALDYVNEVEELETLLESRNQTLILKVISILKDKGVLNSKHKEIALNIYNYCNVNFQV
ncbi:MAG: hypothetical protein MJ231_08680 [bacterium]|nr:hypothetical protein [bacterium]